MAGTKTNLEILQELHDKAAAYMDAMLPILAAELNLPVGVVTVDLVRAKGYAGVVVSQQRYPKTSLVGVSRAYHDNPRDSLLVDAVADLKQSIIDAGFEAKEKEASDDK